MTYIVEVTVKHLVELEAGSMDEARDIAKEWAQHLKPSVNQEWLSWVDQRISKTSVTVRED